jgi:hypothetical protein
MNILEAVGANLGPNAAKGLKKSFGDTIAVVGGHAVADKGHTKELEDRSYGCVLRTQGLAQLRRAVR